MDVLFRIAFVGWLLLAASWLFFRKPEVSLFTPVWRPWRPRDYVNPVGSVLWTVGAGIFLVCWVASFFWIVLA